MLRKLVLLGSGFILIICLVFIAIHIWIGRSVKGNIETAKLKFSGKAEDALIMYLTDTTISSLDRTHIAIWTLGSIKSEKALPILYEYYKNDSVGETCFGKHNSLLCQHEIYKAIKTIERPSFISYSYMKRK